MKKLDLRRKYKHLYQPSARKVEVVEVPEFSFAVIDGRIEKGHAPGDSPAFLAAIQALFGISYTLKFQSKLRKKNAIDYPVMVLEALWWVEDGHFELSKPDNWRWRAMMMQPTSTTKSTSAIRAEARPRSSRPCCATRPRSAGRQSASSAWSSPSTGGRADTIATCPALQSASCHPAGIATCKVGANSGEEVTASAAVR
jgi:hypothetical protein